MALVQMLVDIPDVLLEQDRQAIGGATKTETIQTALRLLVQQRRQQEAIAWLVESAPFSSDGEPAE